MALQLQRFPPPIEAQFRAARMAAMAEINVTTYWLVALLVLLFAWWDWFVDPANWKTALAIRSLGAAVIIASGVVQRVSGRIDLAPVIARIRFSAAVLAVAGALSVLDQGFVVGLAGLVAILLAGPYIALDRRDLMVLNAIAAAGIVAIMWLAGLERFAIVNACIFLALAVAVSLLLGRVFEVSNRRAFALELDLLREARTDALTGLLNRRALEEIAGVELKRSQRSGDPLSVILCDVDHFKRINDRFGHGAGDLVLRAVADVLRAGVRETDALGRWGGEEFLAILPATHEHDASLLAERLRVAIEAVALPIDPDEHVTISFGVADLIALGEAAPGEWSQLVKSADDAMYRAKDAGRNRVVAAGKSVPSGSMRGTAAPL